MTAIMVFADALMRCVHSLKVKDKDMDKDKEQWAGRYLRKKLEERLEATGNPPYNQDEMQALMRSQYEDLVKRKGLEYADIAGLMLGIKLINVNLMEKDQVLTANQIGSTLGLFVSRTVTRWHGTDSAAEKKMKELMQDVDDHISAILDKVEADRKAKAAK